jgi:Carboxypeptidase regulatory-like domain
MRRQSDRARYLPERTRQVIDFEAKYAQTFSIQPKWSASLLLLGAVFLFVLVTPAAAQLVASISGVLSDPSGAAVPGATLILIDQDTTLVTATAKSDASGNFEFLAVRAPGSYTISVQVPGFARIDQKNIVVTAGERRSVGTLPLTISTTSEAVTVSAEVTPVQTSSAERSGDLDKHEISALLARGLNFAGLLRSLPGVAGGVDPTSPAGNSGQAYSALNGARASVSLPTIDGVNATDPSSQGQLYGASAIDTLSEINVKMSNYQAEYGGSAGGIVNLTTRSGAKEVHGDVYLYLRNEDLNANDFFNNKNKVVKPRYRYGIGGISVGGPMSIFMPRRLGRLRNKVFFFVNDQYLYNGNPGSLQQVTMPTALERAGDFSQSTTVQGVLIPVYQPGTKIQYPGNIVPASQINAFGSKLLNFFPLPNFNNRAVSGGNYNYLFQDSPLNRANQYTYRMDFVFTDKLRMYGRNTQINSDNQGYSPAVATGPTWGLAKGFYDQRIETPAVNLLYTIRPTLINELTLGMNHWDEPGGPLTAADLAKEQRSTYGLDGLGQWYPSSNPLDYLPTMSFSDVPSAAGFSYDSRNPIRGATTIFTATDAITKIWGKHTIKAGTTISRSRAWKGNQGNYYSGNFSFGKDVNNPLDSNYGYANAIQGIYDTYQEASARPGADYRSGSFEEFVQDSWKVAPRLTLEIGIRLTTWRPWFQRSNIQSGFDPKSWVPANAPELFQPALNASGQRVAVNPLTGVQYPAVMIGALLPGVGNILDGLLIAGQPGVPQGLTNVQRVTPGPRFGFAWDVFGNGKTAARGGFGISTLPQTEINTSEQAQPPFSYRPTAYYGTLNTFLSAAGAIFPSSVQGTDWSKLAQMYSFSTGIQQSVGFATVIDVAFVGNLGRHLLQAQQLNTIPYGARFLPSSQDPTNPGKPLPDSFLAPYTGVGSINYGEPVGTSNYYALQIQANRRFAHGLEFKTNFTWSKSMDYVSSDVSSLPLYANRKLFAYDLSSFDRTYIANFAWLYELPVGQHLKNSLAKATIGGWNVAGTLTFASGAPSSVSFSNSAGVDLIGGGDGQRIDISANPNLPRGTRNGNEWFDTSVFSLPPLGYIGSASRYPYRGPGQNQWDLSVFKNFSYRERAKAQLRGEFYNAFNHTQWSGINASAVFNTATGVQTNSLFGQATSDRGPRVIQIALRVDF